MTDFIFNIAKGRIAELAALGAANDALIWVPIETSGIVSDATMKDYTDLATLLAGACNEQTTIGRVTATSVTVTPDYTNDWVDIDAADPSFTGAGNAVSKLLLCYDYDTTTGTDSSIVPLAAFDWVVTPSGTTTAVLPSSPNGCMRAS